MSTYVAWMESPDSRGWEPIGGFAEEGDARRAVSDFLAAIPDGWLGAVTRIGHNGLTLYRRQGGVTRRAAMAAGADPVAVARELSFDR